MNSPDHASESQAMLKLREAAMEDAVKLFDHSNNVLGVLAFATGIGCLGLKNPSFYAGLSMFFIALAWGVALRGGSRRLRAINKTEKYRLSTREVIVGSATAFSGWAFLGLIAIDVLDSAGISR
jgi:hypothetical protein